MVGVHLPRTKINRPVRSVMELPTIALA